MTHSTRWTSRTSFIFATAAAAIGLGNIWRFPYLAGQHGGGAFVLLYLFFVIILGLPLMTSEVMLGRMGRANPIKALSNVAERAKRSKHWGLLGGLTILAGFLILSYYVVIIGWVLDYFIRAIAGQLSQTSETNTITSFQALQSNYWRMFASDTVVVAATISVIALGVNKGLERTVMIMFPALIVLILVLVGYGISTGHFGQAVAFLFKPNLTKINPHVALLALGQAFFSLNISMSVNIMFSAYLPEKVPIVGSVMAVAFADTAIALLAGLAIFPVVFANGLTPGSGPSLIFRTLPLACANIPFGNVVGALFFLLLLFAAFTSAISLLEPGVAWLMERFQLSRTKAVLSTGLLCWLISFGTIFSFSHGHQFHIAGFTFFQGIDFLTSDIMLPIGGLLIAIFTGWLLPPHTIENDLEWRTDHFWFRCWRWLKRYFAPVAIAFILLMSLKIL